MIRTGAIKIPNDPRFKVFANGYVYFKEKTSWDKEKRHSTDDRRCVGKLCSEKEGFFRPNAIYYSLFPDSEIKEEPGEIDDYLHFGSYLALRESAEKCGALGALKAAFPKKWEDILAYSVFMVDSEKARSQRYEKWGFSNYAGIGHVISSEDTSRMFASVGYSDIDVFMTEFRKRYRESGISDRKLVIAFDSTNINTNSKGIETAEFGHPKKNEKLPVASTAMGVDESTGIPVYYEDFIGSLLDKTQLEATRKKIREIGFRKVFLVFDRGYYKSEEIREIAKSNSFAIMVPDNVATSFDYIEKNGMGIRNREAYFMKSENAYGIQLESDAFLGMHSYTYIFYDGTAAETERDTIHSKILAAESLLERKKYDKATADEYSEYLTIKKGRNGKNIVVEKTEKIQREIDFAGFFMAVSNEKMAPEEMLSRLRKRDRAEKVFCQMKSFTDSEKCYCHGTQTYIGRNFVLFFALVMRLAFRFFEKDCFKKESYVSNDTTATVLGHVSKLIAYKTKGNGWQRKYALTSKMKSVFGNLGYDEKKIDEFLRTEVKSV